MTLDKNTLLEAAKVCAEQFERDLPNQKSGGQSQDYSDGYLYGTYDCARAIRALADAQPEGWVLVPRELLIRCDAALQRHRDGHAPMRVPVDQTDSDVVQAEIRTMLSAAGGKS